jgi:hypothetical protein
MQYLPWILAGIFAIVAFLQFTAAKSAYQKLNVLNEYIQFLLFQPKVYNDHRDKFLGFVAQRASASVSDQAMASYQAVENMAAQLYDHVLLANVKMRSQPHESPSGS